MMSLQGFAWLFESLQECCKGFVFGWYWRGLFDAFHNGFDMWGDFDALAGGFFHAFRELDGMCRFQKIAFVAGMGFLPTLQCKVAYGTMWIKQVACIMMHLTDGQRRFVITDAYAAEHITQWCPVMAEDLQNAHEIARVGHIHGI